MKGVMVKQISCNTLIRVHYASYACMYVRTYDIVCCACTKERVLRLATAH